MILVGAIEHKNPNRVVRLASGFFFPRAKSAAKDSATNGTPEFLFPNQLRFVTRIESATALPYSSLSDSARWPDSAA